MTHRILVVDDEQSMRDFLSIFLKKEGFEVETAADGEKALEVVARTPIDLIISDVRMSAMDGMRLLREVKRREASIEVIVMTAYGSTADAIKAMRDGAYDYISKPFKLNEVKVTIQKALKKRELAKTAPEPEVASPPKKQEHNIVGKSAAMQKVFEMINRVADTKTTILITGESGTGKELVARAIHDGSVRAGKAFVTINCGAIPSELMESELFGHLRGSFTGAVRDKDGLFKVADGGTLFLDEVSELPLQLQVKLLRALQERRVTPVGGSDEIPIDTRVIAATNRDLLEDVRFGRFREDLYYRLNVIQVRLPPLRERTEDIPLLVEHFIKRACLEMSREPMRISEAAMMILTSHPYPGNVRELSNLLERAVALENSDQVRPQSLPSHLLERHEESPVKHEYDPLKIDLSRGTNLDAVLEQVEYHLLRDALDQAAGVKTEAAKILGITFRSLRYRLKKHKLDDERENS